MPSVDQIERLLASLQGVISARVVTGSDGRPLEIHILASPELHPKQVVRNIESALTAGLGIEIDRRIVSVSQLRPGTEAVTAQRFPEQAETLEPTPGPEPGLGVPHASNGHAASAAPRAASVNGASRLAFAGFSSRSRSAQETVCEVRLRMADREFTGSAEGPDTLQGRAEAAARAAFDALDRGTPNSGLTLEGVTLVSAHGRTYVLVSAQALEGREPTGLVGAALLERSPEEAAVLATLQATNRLASRTKKNVS